MISFIMVIFVIISVALIVAILAQTSKGGALDGIVGGMATDMMGSQAASGFLRKLTRYLGLAFMLVAIILALLVKNQTFDSESGLDAATRYRQQQATEQVQEAPAEPGTEEPKPTNQLNTESGGAQPPQPIKVTPKPATGQNQGTQENAGQASPQTTPKPADN